MNGFHANGSVMDGESLDSLSEQLDSASLDAAELDSEPATSETTGNHGFNGKINSGLDLCVCLFFPVLRVTCLINSIITINIAFTNG